MIRLGGLEWHYTTALEMWPHASVAGEVPKFVHLPARIIAEYFVDRMSGAREVPRVALARRAAANDWNAR